MKRKKKLAVTVGIAAYNEDANIAKLLDSLLTQTLKKVFISEILVISSGSTDNTNPIVRKYMNKSKKIKLLRQTKRLGKASAVNQILTKAKKDIIVLISADLLLEKETIERLVLPLSKQKNGIIGSRPIPLNNKETFFGFAAHLIWELHHQVSLTRPKMGECIAFRKIFKQIPAVTSVDEANIESLIKGQGYQAVYEPKAVVYNMGAQNLTDYIARRRHIYAGHLATMQEYGYVVSTINSTRIFFLLLKNSRFTLQYIFWTPVVVALEIFSRLLGYFDQKIARKTHTIWHITKSTKKLPELGKLSG